MPRPTGSKITTTKTVDRLEIKIPARFRPDRPERHQIGMTGLVTFCALSILGVVIYIFQQLSVSNNDAPIKIGLCVGLLFTLPMLLWVGKTSLRLLFELADRYCSHTHLEIDDRQLKIVTRLLTLDRSRPQTVQIREIIQIVIDRYRHPQDNSKQANLILDLDRERSVKLFRSGRDLTAPEVEWLGAKLAQKLSVGVFNNDEIEI
jgi:hypothetical protein